MNPFRNSLLLVGLALAVAGNSAAFAAEPIAAGDLLVDETADSFWRELFGRLARQGAVRATFVEERWFAVRKQPVLLRGVLRHEAQAGLSLEYQEPQEQVLVVDHAGLLMRDSRGRTRTMAADPRAPRMDALLLPVLRFDIAEIRRYFEVRAARDGDDWRVDFVPRSKDLERQLNTLTVFGVRDEVRRLEFRRAANQRVVVRIERTETGVVFSPDEIKRFFR